MNVLTLKDPLKQQKLQKLLLRMDKVCSRRRNLHRHSPSPVLTLGT